jgi:hypothetical protein
MHAASAASMIRFIENMFVPAVDFLEPEYEEAIVTMFPTKE